MENTEIINPEGKKVPQLYYTAGNCHLYLNGKDITWRGKDKAALIVAENLKEVKQQYSWRNFSVNPNLDFLDPANWSSHYSDLKTKEAELRKVSDGIITKLPDALKGEKIISEDENSIILYEDTDTKIYYSKNERAVVLDSRTLKEKNNYINVEAEPDCKEYFDWKNKLKKLKKTT